MAQYIVHQSNYSYSNSVFKDIENLYAYLSVKNRNSIIPHRFPRIFKPIIDTFKNESNAKYNVEYIDKQYDKLDSFDINKKNILLCFSGGKDSLAAALHYKKLKYNVFLYHVKGINKVYCDEWKSAEKLATQLNMPIIFETISLKGIQEWIEHPLKNYIIVSMALQYGIRNKLTTKIATGNFYTSYIYDNTFDVCGGDCKDMWLMYENIIRKILPGFHVFVCNRNIQTTYNSLLKNSQYIENTLSCMSPVRFREQLRKKNIKKYGFPKMSGRCGSCWKCCYEYIVLCDNELEEYNKDYYNHCLTILENDYKKEHGYYPIDVWSEYFFYDRSKGRYYDAVV